MTTVEANESAVEVTDPAIEWLRSAAQAHDEDWAADAQQGAHWPKPPNHALDLLDRFASNRTITGGGELVELRKAVLDAVNRSGLPYERQAASRDDSGIALTLQRQRRWTFECVALAFDALTASPPSEEFHLGGAAAACAITEPMPANTPSEQDRSTGAFHREERYIVVKRSHLDEAQETDILDCIESHGIDTMDCVVVEHDWPEYEPVWAMIKERMTRG